MKIKTALLASALTSVGFAAQAAEVTVMSWGGAYTKSQVEAYHKPFTAETGIKINSVDADNPATPIKAQVEAGNVSIDVADVEFSDAVRLCDEGLLEEIDSSILPAAPDGTPAADDFIEGALQDCAVANIVWSTVMAYNTENNATAPDSIDDFFNIADYPGKRGLRKSAKATLEMALMADGVPAGDVYDVLDTDEGVDRAFAKLDSIKSDIVWWEAGAQPPQLLADGEVVMSTAYNGRIFNAAVGEGQPLEIVWDGQILDFDLFVVPKGAPNKDAALQFISFSTDTQRLADQASWISYGPARKSSGALVGTYSDGKTEMAPHMPTAEANLGNALVNNFEFWVDKDAELNERFNAWLAN
ncbi:Spermidine/putrescine-binding periplasmic protein precursor [Tritonibacter multivorans]|uniref:Spermidine/putrescine-binding periplasmic protein n=1 Tax=Tritonibacter multivorans TaxID=928856 RepID=A0A0P1GEN3_9RHOB|nr:ABC transporter substrate-binding protein [Tritonibacter multivorans]MDA7420176.1 ABC transporter substrate-binding protein [Tritonibacter multivorans]CUH79834.1 Spermidine/putrescine-binding periplasmic protein precursor [Tritonibacter multivorans]SFC01430.1 putative spermidine/putrescine transport system substrate-binding protein [Tritonibacter multivorans]